MLGSVLAFAYALFHGFKGSYCLHSYAQPDCGQNVTLTGTQVAWVAPAVFAVGMLILATSSHVGRGRRDSR